MRPVASVIAGAAVAAVGGLVLGEYPFTGWTPWVAGVLFALVVTEVMITIGRRHGPVVAVGGGVFSAGGLGWAVWISSGRGVEPIGSGGWLAIGLGFVVAMARGFLPVVRGGQSPAARSADDSPTALERLDEFIAPPPTLGLSRSVRTSPGEPAPLADEESAPGSLAPAADGFAPAQAPVASEVAPAGSEPAPPAALARTRTGSRAKKAASTARRPPAKTAAKTPAKSVAKSTAASKREAVGKKRAQPKKAAGAGSSAKEASPARKASPAKKAASARQGSQAKKASSATRRSTIGAGSAAKKAGTGSTRRAPAVKAAKSPVPRSRSGGR